MKTKKKRRKHLTLYSIIALAAVYLCRVSMGLGERGVSLPGEECMLYYIVNADGMKGLRPSLGRRNGM